jgi:uncharacterized protein (TIGR00255 family)
MTGFGSGRASAGSEEVTVELRSVNGKFGEVKPRLPRELLALEADAVRMVKERITRGNVELTVRRGDAGALEPRVDEELAGLYAARFRALQQRLGLPGELRVSDLIAAEGVVTMAERPPDVEAAGRALASAIAQALEQLVSMREREGAALGEDLRSRVATVEAVVDRLAAEAPAAVEHYRTRLAERIREILGEGAVDPQRLAHEVALFAERSDVAEELTRLRSHLVQFRRLLEAEEPAGRRMDFLVQEMNREVNTVGAKSQWAGSAALVVELKSELERIREQVQNVE